jgi:hypothetical protein
MDLRKPALGATRDTNDDAELTITVIAGERKWLSAMRQETGFARECLPARAKVFSYRTMPFAYVAMVITEK